LKPPEPCPLVIAEVPAMPGGGRIGICACPGGRAPGGASRDLAVDLDRIAAWGAAAVLTLVRPRELERLGVADLGDAVRQRGMEWHHLPIHDMDTPRAAFEAAWQNVGAKLRDRLRGGDDILIHCRAGLGRAGTIAARLLVELGTDPETAVTAVRSVRPGAIETDPQYSHVLQAKFMP
jgi:ADP-ribosyl-[dinitrogen reductase] hydrolase